MEQIGTFKYFYNLTINLWILVESQTKSIILILDLDLIWICRGYYRCSTVKGCPARKHVERSRDDPTMLLVTYDGDHRHPQSTVTDITASLLSHKTRNWDINLSTHWAVTLFLEDTGDSRVVSVYYTSKVKTSLGVHEAIGFGKVKAKYTHVLISWNGTELWAGRVSM